MLEEQGSERNRRDFLKRATLAAAGICVWLAAATLEQATRPFARRVPRPRKGPRDGRLDTRIASLLMDVIPDRQSAAAVGQAYLETNPAARSASLRLARQLLAGPAASREALRQTLRARCARDFEGGNTIFVRGWLLAETEAQVAALAVLLSKRA